jgi:hypothetical protein
MASTKDVIDHHLKCFGEGDLKGTCLITPRMPSCSRRTAQGTRRDQAVVPADGCRVWKARRDVQHEAAVHRGDHAYILWSAETADNVYELGTDTFVVRDGKIVGQSFTGKVTPKASKPAETQLQPNQLC